MLPVCLLVFQTLCIGKMLLLITVSECQLLVHCLYVYSVISLLYLFIFHIMGYLSFKYLFLSEFEDLILCNHGRHAMYML